MRGHIWNTVSRLKSPSSRKTSLNWRQLAEDHRDGGELEHLPCEETLMEPGLFSLEKEMASGGPASSPSVNGAASLLHQGDGVRLRTVMRGKRMRGDRYKLKQGVQAGYKEKHFHCDGSQAWEWVCPGRLCSVHPRGFSRNNWTKP